MVPIDTMDPGDEDVAFYARFCRCNVINKEVIARSIVVIHNTIVTINRKRARRNAAQVKPKPKNARVKCVRLKTEHAEYHTINAKKMIGTTRALKMISEKMNAIRIAVKTADEQQALSQIREIL